MNALKFLRQQTSRQAILLSRKRGEVPMIKASVLPKRRQKAGGERNRKVVVQRQPAPAQQEPETLEVAIDKIKWPFLIRRVNTKHLVTLAGADSLPPIRVRDRGNGTYEGIDGKHRYDLAKLDHVKTVKVVVLRYESGEEGQKSLELDRLRFNLEHGLPLTADERNREILRLWRNWGRSPKRPDGLTEEDLGKKVGLTKQRISQIINDPKNVPSDESQTDSDSTPQRRGFDDIALLGAATKRLSKILSGDVIRRLLEDDKHKSTVITELARIQASIESILKGNSASEAA